MKKIYILCVVLYSSISFAQTLEQADLPFAGLVWTSGVDTNYTAPVPAGGTGQNWNFSNLQDDYIDTSGFQNAAGTPYASTFPSANLATHRQSTGEWSYFTNSSSGFYVNGFATDSTVFVVEPRQMYVPVPFSYGDTHIDDSRIVFQDSFLTYPAMSIIHFHSTFDADGTGSLTTPTATYPSTLRIKEIILQTDSFLLDTSGTGNYILFGLAQSQKTYFRWFQHGATANYIMSLDADSLGNFATRSDYLKQWANLGTNDLVADNHFNTYPNPAANILIISGILPNVKEISIFNCLEEKILVHGTANQSLMNGELKLDISNWTSGVYFYYATSGERQFSGRFNVMH